MALDPTRKTILEALLTQANVPFTGVTINELSATPPDVDIAYTAGATAEQIALGEQILSEFDWRRRRALGLGACLAVVNSLTAQQITAILRLQAADYLRKNPLVAATVAALAGAPLPLDEIDPS